MKLTQQISFDHIRKYSQYAQNIDWARWYAKVASLKAQRVVKVLLRYKHTNSKLLDLGCGTGMTFSALAQTFPNSIALDIGDHEVKATKELLSHLKMKANVQKYDGKTIPYPTGTFDIVTSIEVIEHVKDPLKMLGEIRRVLKHDGILHITTANKWWPIEPHFKLPFLSYLPPRLSDLYVRLSGRGDSYLDIKLPSYNQFRRMIEKYFTIEDITLDILRDYKVYNLDKERGKFIRVVGRFLSFVKLLETNPISRPIALFIKILLSNISLGWLFIARPQN